MGVQFPLPAPKFYSLPMLILELILVILASYTFIVFFLARLVIPFYGFQKYITPRDLPPDMRKTITELEHQSSDQKSFLEHAYVYMQDNWHSERLKTITALPLIFRTDIDEVWHSRGYAHCTTINFILYTLLVNSRFFTEEDIRIRHVFFNGVIHQYLEVQVGLTWIDADPSTKYLRLPLGQHSRWFG